MTKDEALNLALEALENNRRTHYYCEDTWYSCPKHEDGCANEAEGDECNCGADKANQEIDNAITAIKQARALDKMAENARELGLDYEPVWCGHCNGSGRMVRDPDIGTDQKCFVCDGAGVPAAPVQSAERAEPVAWWNGKHGSPVFAFERDTPGIGLGNPDATPLYTTPPAAQRQPLTDEQIKQIYTEQTGSFIDDSPWALLDFARAIEAAHGIKEKNSD